MLGRIELTWATKQPGFFCAERNNLLRPLFLAA
jgi:hypothetical protein